VPVFTLRYFESIPGAIKRIAVLEIDGKAPYQDFAIKMSKSGNRKEFDRLKAAIDELMLGNRLPPNKVKEIREKTTDDGWKEFELRHKRLRIYYFLVPPDGNIIVMGEYKKSDKAQRKTIRSFQEIKQLFKEAFLDDQIKFEEE